MKEISAEANITESGQDSFSLPQPHHSYLGMAKAFSSGANALASVDIQEAISIGLLSAQCVECALKAYLSRFYLGGNLKDPAIRHNLEALWSLAVSNGLHAQASSPDWIKTLSHLHSSPYYLRYSPGVHGLVLPNMQTMVCEIGILVSQVEQQILQQ